MIDDIRIEVNREELSEIREKLGKLQEKAPIALYRSVNDAASKAKTETKRAIAGQYNIAQKEVAPTLSVSKAHRKKLWATLKSKGSPIALSKFDVSPEERPTHKNGVYSPPVYKADVKKSTGKRPLDGSPKAFITKMKSGHKGVVERISKKGRSLPLKQLYGPSAPSMMNNEQAMEQIKEMADITLQKRLDHHIQYILQRG